MSASLIVDSQVTVETPEGVDFRFRTAGPGRRGIAFLVDWVVKIVILIAVGFLFGIFSVLGDVGAGLGTGLMLFALFAISWLYGGLFETIWDGQTPGKRTFRLRVVRRNGTPIGFYEAFGRNLLLVGDAFPGCYTVGVLSMLCTQRMQRLGDLVFDTMVIYEQRERVNADQKALRVAPLQRLECGNRFDLPDRTLSIIESLFDRRRGIVPTRKEELATILADTIRKRLGVEPPDPLAMNQFENTMFLRRVLRTFGTIENVSESPEVAELNEVKIDLHPDDDGPDEIVEIREEIRKE